MKMGQKHCTSNGGPDGPGQTVEVYKLEMPKEEVTVLVGVGLPAEAGTQQGGQH